MLSIDLRLPVCLLQQGALVTAVAVRLYCDRWGKNISGWVEIDGKAIVAAIQLLRRDGLPQLPLAIVVFPKAPRIVECTGKRIIGRHTLPCYISITVLCRVCGCGFVLRITPHCCNLKCRILGTGQTNELPGPALTMQPL